MAELSTLIFAFIFAVCNALWFIAGFYGVFLLVTTKNYFYETTAMSIIVCAIMYHLLLEITNSPSFAGITSLIALGAAIKQIAEMVIEYAKQHDIEI